MAEKHILLLHSQENSTGWTRSIAAGAAAALPDSTQVHQEFLGETITDEEHFHATFERLKLTTSVRPEGVIASDPLAAAFVRKYHDELFAGVPTILVSRTGSGTEQGMCADCTPLPLTRDMDKMVELVLSLRPDTTIVVGITDSTALGQARKKALEKALRPYRGKIQTIFPGQEPGDDNGLSLDTLGEVFSGMPNSGVMIFLQFTQDNRGNPIFESQIVKLFETRTVTPIFVFTDAFLGSGVVGGMLVKGEDVGREAVHLIQRIQAGESVKEMLPKPVNAQIVLDGTPLARFGMRPPYESTVVNPLKTLSEPEEIASIPTVWWTVGLLVFAGLLFVLRRYRQ